MHTYLGGTVLKGGVGGKLIQQGKKKKEVSFLLAGELTSLYISLSFSQSPLTATILSSQEKVYLCETHQNIKVSKNYPGILKGTFLFIK